MDYKIVKYSEIGKIRSGKRLPKGYIVSEEISDNKYIRVRDINNGSIDSSMVQYITDEAAEKLERYRVKIKDVIISVVGTVGAIAQIDESLDGAYLTENCDNLQVDESICLKDYLKYYLLSADGSKEIIANTVGSTQPKLPIYGIENFNIKLPNIDNQKRIVKLLNSIDKKIKLNNEINNNLHKYCIDLFNETFNEFEYEDTLDNICVEITRGFTKGYVEKSNLINLNQKVNKGEVLEKQYYKYLDENQVIPENRYVKENDILLNSLGQGTLGRVHLFGEKTSNVVIDQHITILRTGNQINPYYLYYLLISPEYQNKIENSVTGTTGMLMLNISAVRNMKIPVPSQKDLNSFKVIVAPIRKKITNSNLENEILIQLRNALLPKLINGEIDLDNIEI